VFLRKSSLSRMLKEFFFAHAQSVLFRACSKSSFSRMLREFFFAHAQRVLFRACSKSSFSRMLKEFISRTSKEVSIAHAQRGIYCRCPNRYLLPMRKNLTEVLSGREISIAKFPYIDQSHWTEFLQWILFKKINKNATIIANNATSSRHFRPNQNWTEIRKMNGNSATWRNFR